MPRHQLPRIALLEYALEGAITYRGVWSGEMSDDEFDQVNADIAEIERRLELARQREDEKENKS